VGRGLLADQRVAREHGLGHTLVKGSLGAQALDHAALGEVDGDVLAEVDRSDGEVVAPVVSRRGQHALGGHVPHRPDPIEIGVLREHGGGNLLGVAGEVGPGDALLFDDLDVRVLLGDRRLESVVALLGDEEVRLVEQDPDLALAAQLLGHQVGRGDTVAVVVGRDDAHVVVARSEPVRDVVHEHELHTLVRSLTVGGFGGNRVGRNGDDDVRLLGEHGLDVRDLRLRLEVGVRYGDHLDAHLGELLFQPVNLGVRPVVSAVVEDDRGSRVLRLDLL
jgi:hypothetical protein